MLWFPHTMPHITKTQPVLSKGTIVYNKLSRKQSTKRSNPLLTALRMSPKLCPPCIRAYTSVRQDGSFRAKFYDIGTKPIRNTRIIYSTLWNLGWRNICIKNHINPFRHDRMYSLTITAQKD